ncbi:hypothetical protein DSO57_1029765 [Entomophthora muscae]|uniref:Uncharacterized protein n=1 Tax=Entomophthora muscae TaxID=34485 RepID=A0ACC2RFS2_9FUNG|nr:hypothetical protein DSO57_1029765 [Entomophthora muscae]
MIVKRAPLISKTLFKQLEWLMFDIDMVQIKSIALFSFLAATLAAPAYKSTYGEYDNGVSVKPCFYFDGTCHNCPSSEFWDGQCHKFPGDDIIMPGNGKHANGKGYGDYSQYRREIYHHSNNRPHGNRHGHGNWNNVGSNQDNSGSVKCRKGGIDVELNLDQLLRLEGHVDLLKPCHN